MSLIHWWPLNGDLKDKISNSAVNGTYTSTEGKIGLGLSTTTIHSTKIPLTEWSPIGTGASLSCWVKFNYNDIKTFMNSASVGYNTPTGNIIGSDSWGGLGLIWLGDSVNNFSTIRVMACVRGLTSTDAYAGTESARYTMPYDEWVHLAVVANAQNKEIKMYVNGIQYGEIKKYSSLAKIPDIEKRYFTFNSNYIYGGNGPGYAIPMKLNDIRLYDHALSKAEVKELSKALIIHYTFNDPLMESTTNLLYGVWPHTNFSQAPLGPYNSFSQQLNGGSCEIVQFNGVQCLRLQALDGNQTGRIYSTYDLTANKTYTIAFDYYASVTHNQALHTEMHGGDYTWKGKSCAYTTPNQWKRLSVTLIPTSDTKLYIFAYAKKNNYYAYINNIQLEEKDHATPYTISNRAGMVYNETGLTQPNNNTIQDVQLVKDAAINKYSLKCNNTKILTPITGDISQGATLSLWINLPKDNNGNNISPSVREVVVADNNSQLAFGFYNGTHGIITCNGFTKPIMTNLTTALVNDWNHIAVIRDSNNNVKGYLNGVEYPLADNQEWAHNEPYFSIGCRYNGSWTSYYNGQVDDIRLYNTCLSPEEIKELYNCGGRISNLGDTLTGSFIEGAAAIQINKNHTIDSNEIIEQDEAKASFKKNGTIFARQIIEI